MLHCLPNFPMFPSTSRAPALLNTLKMWHNVKAYNLIYLKLIYCDGRNNLRPDRDLNPDPLNLDMLYQQSNRAWFLVQVFPIWLRSAVLIATFFESSSVSEQLILIRLRYPNWSDLHIRKSQDFKTYSLFFWCKTQWISGNPSDIDIVYRYYSNNW